MSDQYDIDPPQPVADTKAGLATHPGILQPHEKILTARSGSQHDAYRDSVKALENVHQSLGDMTRAVDAMSMPRRENMVLGPRGTVSYVVPENQKEQVRQAMSQSFDRGARRLADANKVIDKAESQLQNAIDSRIQNPRRNETAIAATATQIRDLVRGLAPLERVPFVRQAILDGDLEITAAVLHHSPFVSGLTRAQQTNLRADAERQFAPGEVSEREALRAVKERLAGAGSHYLQRLQQILPVPNVRQAEAARALKKLQTGV
jgi:hypothetical protein